MENKVWTKEERRLKVEEYLKNGGSVKNYAAAIGVGYSTFSKWLSRYRLNQHQEPAKGAAADSMFVELVCEKTPSKVSEPLTGIEMRLPSKIILALPPMSPTTLVLLIQELNHAHTSS